MANPLQRAVRRCAVTAGLLSTTFGVLALSATPAIAGPVDPCATLASGTPCDDGDACTVDDQCQGGVCAPGSPVVCAAPGSCREQGVCDPSTGACSNPPAADGAPCSDGNACSLGDECTGGVCYCGVAVVCPPPPPCFAVGVCDHASGECAAPVAVAEGTACDDGDPCTQSDVCSSGICAGHGDCSTGPVFGVVYDPDAPTTPLTVSALDRARGAGGGDAEKPSSVMPTAGCSVGALSPEGDAPWMLMLGLGGLALRGRRHLAKLFGL